MKVLEQSIDNLQEVIAAFSKTHKSVMDLSVIDKYLQNYEVFQQMGDTLDEQQLMSIYSEVRVKKYRQYQVMAKESDETTGLTLLLQDGVLCLKRKQTQANAHVIRKDIARQFNAFMKNEE